MGCDAIYNEDFRLRIQYNKDGSVNWMYDEPDFGKYESLKMRASVTVSRVCLRTSG